MNFKRLIPNNIKQESKYILLDLLKQPYSRSGAPLELLNWLPENNPITFFDIRANARQFSKSICGEYKIKRYFDRTGFRINSYSGNNISLIGKLSI